jgi:hypothetical protein
MEDLEFEELLKIINNANKRICFCFKRQISAEEMDRVNEKLENNFSLKLRIQA